MNKILRTLAAVLAIFLISPAAVGATPGQAAPASPVVPGPNDAIDDLVSCIQGSHRLLVSFLIDESGSLQANDPKARRVDVAENALDQLVVLADGSGGGAPTSVDVTFAAFSNTYAPVRDWTSLSKDAAPGLRASLEKFRARDKGNDTDFDTALTGAREALAQRVSEVTSDQAGSAPPCKAILLFTDGGFDIALRTPANSERLGRTKPYAPGVDLTTEAGRAKARQAGVDELCRKGGVADQIRTDDITLLTVALVGNVDVDTQRPLAAATAGKADDFTCGTPTDRVPGAYLLASGADALISRFDEVTTRVAGGTPVDGDTAVTACGKDACDEGTRSFKLDQGVRRAHLLAVVSSGPASVELTGAGGATVTVERAGPFKVGDVSGTASTVAGGALSIDLSRPKDSSSDAWDGQWTAAVTSASASASGKPATLSVFLFSDLGIELGGADGVVRGGTATITANLVVPKGLDPKTLLTSATATVRLVDPVSGSSVSGFGPVALAGPPAGPFSGTLAVPADTSVNALEATVALRATTTGGAVITSQSATRELPVRRPEGSIQFAPAVLQLPSAKGTSETSTTLILAGGAAPGCVWIGRTRVLNAPDGAAPISVSLDGRTAVTKTACIKVPAKGLVKVDLGATASGRSVGTVRGTVEVFEQVEGKAVSTTLMPFRYDLTRGIDQARRLALAVGLAAGGVLLPMLLLYLVNAATARFQRFDVVLGANLPVVISDGRVRQSSGSRSLPLSLLRSDFGPLSHTESKRRFSFGGVQFRARAARNPFAAIIASAAPEGGAEKLKGGAGSKVELDPGLAGSWVFLLDADETRAAPIGTAKGAVLVFVADGDLDVQTARMLPDIEQRLPKIADTLARALLSTTPKRQSRRQVRAATEPGEDQPGDDKPDDKTDDGKPDDGPDDTGPPLGFGGIPRP